MKYLLLLLASCAPELINSNYRREWRDTAFIRCVQQSGIVCQGAGADYGECLDVVMRGCQRGFR